MKKVIIIGCPGSGKSIFARSLESLTGLPLHHLDMMYWNKDKTTVTKDIFIKRLQSVMEKDSWIIDGNYQSSMEMRLGECDTVFFLDYSTQVCLEGIRSRKGKARSDIPFVDDENDEEFISFIKEYNSKVRPQVISLLEKYRDRNIIVFNSREESENFLSSFERMN